VCAAGWARFEREDGQTMTEYSLVLVLVAVALVVTLTALKTGIAGEINKVINALK
jgi:Flp pilus assembly pilin Flp